MNDPAILLLNCRGTAAPQVLAGFGNALRAQKYRVVELDLEALCPPGAVGLPEALSRTVRELSPQLAITYAVPRGASLYRENGAFWLDELDIPLMGLFYDNPFVYLQEIGASAVERLKRSGRFVACCSDLAYVEDLRRLGFERAEYLPLAADTDIFFPCTDRIPLEPYRSEVAFVGSVHQDIAALQRQRRQRWARFPVLNKKIDEICENSGGTSLEVAQQLQRLEQYFPWDMYAVLCRTVYEEMTSVLRLRIISGIQAAPVSVFGGEGWRQIGRDRVRCGAAVDYRRELPLVYSATSIVLNLTSPQLRTAVSQRLFDVSACSGFVLSDYRKDVRRLFGDTIETFDSIEDLNRKITYFLANPRERQERARAARENVLRAHTYAIRSRELMDIAQATVLKSGAQVL